jgi:TPR repeat protein
VQTYEGRGVEPSTPGAIEWFRKAAAQGHEDAKKNLEILEKEASSAGASATPAPATPAELEARAMGGDLDARFLLGLRYYQGDGVTQDFMAAFEHWKTGAERGHARCQFNLGVLYAGGLGVGSSPEEAAAWTRRAADKGLVEAQVEMGRLLQLGRGVKRSLPEARSWLEKAAAQGDKNAPHMIRLMEQQKAFAPLDELFRGKGK